MHTYYVYVYIYIYIYTHTHSYIHIHINKHQRIHTSIYNMYIPVCTNTWTDKWTYRYMCMYVYIYTYIHKCCKCAYIHACRQTDGRTRISIFRKNSTSQYPLWSMYEVPLHARSPTALKRAHLISQQLEGAWIKPQTESNLKHGAVQTRVPSHGLKA